MAKKDQSNTPPKSLMDHANIQLENERQYNIEQDEKQLQEVWELVKAGGYNGPDVDRLIKILQINKGMRTNANVSRNTTVKVISIVSRYEERHQKMREAAMRKPVTTAGARFDKHKVGQK